MRRGRRLAGCLLGAAMLAVAGAGPAHALSIAGQVQLLQPAGDTETDFGREVLSFGTTAVVAAPGRGLISSGGRLYLYDHATGGLLRTVDPAPDTGFFGFALAEYDSLLAAARLDFGDVNAELIDASSGTLVEVVPIVDRSFRNEARLAVDGLRLISVNRDYIQVYDRGAGATIFSGTLARSAATIQFDAGDLLVGDARVGTAAIVDPYSGALILDLPNPTGNLSDGYGASVAFMGSVVLVGAPERSTSTAPGGVVYVFDRATGMLRRLLHEPAPRIRNQFGSHMVVSPDLDRVFVSDAQGVWIVDPTTGETLLDLRRPGQNPRAISASIDGARLVVGCAGEGDAYTIADQCGDGIRQQGERCDDGNAIDGDGCSATCRLESCGDGGVDLWEECDDGNADDGDGCDRNCTFTACGNGIRTGTEQCDDGNTTDGDGCDSGCLDTLCGNGIVTTGEVCDDGNLVSSDGCDENCLPTGCGNGVVTAGETCDDGGLAGGDGCSAACRAEAPQRLKCYKGKLQPGAPFAPPSISVSDALLTDTAELVKPLVFCGEALTGVASVASDAPGTLCYKAKRSSITGISLQVTDAFGTLDLAVRSAATVCPVASDGSHFAQRGRLRPPPDPFGFGISLQGARAMASLGADVVAAVKVVYRAGSTDTIYRFDGTTGLPGVEFLHPGGLSNVRFGEAIASDGTRVFISAPGDVSAPPAVGAVFVFDANTGAHVQTITSPMADGVRIGHTMAVVGSRLAVGRPDDVLVFDAASGAFEGVVGGVVPDTMAVAGSELVVGAGNEGTAGMAWLVDPVTRTVTSALSPIGLREDDSFGAAVAAASGLVYVAAPFDDKPDSAAGAVHVFDQATGTYLRTIRSNWALSGTEFGRDLLSLGPRIAASGASVTALYEATEQAAMLQPFAPLSPTFAAVSAGQRLFAALDIIEDRCGDGTVDPHEECDDANAVSGDGCSAICRLESHTGYACYKVRPLGLFVPPSDIGVKTKFEHAKATRIIKPSELCLPAGIGGGTPDPQASPLMCYKVKSAKGEAKFARELFRVRDRFGGPLIDVSKPKLFCVASTVTGIP